MEIVDVTVRLRVPDLDQQLVLYQSGVKLD